MKNVLRVMAVYSYLFYATYTMAANDPIIWKFKTGGIVFATPIVHNNVLYIGSVDSVFYAMSAANGTELWHYKTNNQIRSTAAIDGNIVCFESGNQLYGLDLQGNLLWHDTLYAGPVTNQFDQWDFFHSSPNIVNGVAYIGTEKGRVYGINMQTGAVVFQCQTQNTNNGIRTAPAVYGNKIYFGNWDGIFYAYDLNTGQKLWEYNTFPERGWTGGLPSITTAPVLFNGNVFFAGRSCILYALNAETGVKQWSYSDRDMWLVGGPTISDSILYLGSSYQQVLRIFNAVTGTRLYEQSVDARVDCTPFVNGDYVYIGTGFAPADTVGSIYIFDKRTGEKKNKYALRAMVQSPIIVDSILYVGCADTYVYAMNKLKLLTNPFSNTSLKDRKDVRLGRLDHDTTLTIQIDNTGEGSDSVIVTIVGVNPLSAVIVNPASFVLMPHTFQNVSVTIQPSQLTPKSYGMAFRITSVSNLEIKTYSKLIFFSIPQSNSVGKEKETLPHEWTLGQNFPNPFNPSTSISFSLPLKSFVSLKIFDLIGREVATLVSEQMPAGNYSKVWNANEIPSGIYFYRLTAVPSAQLDLVPTQGRNGQADRYSETKKIVLLK
jgi:outer membrane protein assembly factor BamB